MLDSTRQPREMRLTPRNTVLSMTFDDSAVIAASPALCFQVFTLAHARVHKCAAAIMARRSLCVTIIALSVVYCCSIGVKADRCIVERDNPCRCTTHSISIDLSTYFTDPQ